jgi:hypothetical protein
MSPPPSVLVPSAGHYGGERVGEQRTSIFWFCDEVLEFFIAAMRIKVLQLAQDRRLFIKVALTS